MAKAVQKAYFVMRLAGLRIGIYYTHPWIAKQCEAYLDADGPVVFDVRATSEQIDAERELAAGSISDAYLESTCLCRNICQLLPLHDCFVVHAAAVALGQDGYLIAGKSGSGKTTHALQWKAALDASIINGDKPVLRLENGGYRVYSSPWRGKEGLHQNRSAVLKAVFFVEKAGWNRAERLSSAQERRTVFLQQLLWPADAEAALKTLRFADRVLRAVPFFRLWCTPEPASAQAALKAAELDGIG